MITIRNRRKEKIIQYMQLKELRDRRCNEIITQQGAEPAQGMSQFLQCLLSVHATQTEDSECTPVPTLWGRHLMRLKDTQRVEGPTLQKQYFTPLSSYYLLNCPRMPVVQSLQVNQTQKMLVFLSELGKNFYKRMKTLPTKCQVKEFFFQKTYIST